MLGAASDLGEFGGLAPSLGEDGADPILGDDGAEELIEPLRLCKGDLRACFAARSAELDPGHTSLGTTGGDCCFFCNSGGLDNVLPAPLPASEERSTSCLRSCSNSIERDSIL